MNRILTLPILLAFFFILPKAKSQCPLASTCAAACVVCDLNGYTSTANQPIPGQMPPGYCTMVQHTMHWIGFIAGSTNLTISVNVYNCNQPNGLEMGIYESSDCSNFNLVSNCNTNMFANQYWTFTNFAPLTVGNTYYLVFDANGANVCDISVSVISGSTQAPAIDQQSIIDGPIRVCRGASIDYIASTVPGANRYIWTWDGAPIGQGLQVSPPTFGTGTHQLCIEPSNNCNDGQPTCIDVEVYDIPPTPVADTICNGDCYTFLQNTYCSPGVFPHVLNSYQGCDSLVILTLYSTQSQIGQARDTICQGDTLWFNNTPFSSNGVHRITIPTNGCDSTFLLNLTVKPAKNSSSQVQICQGDFYRVGDSTFTKSGRYTVPFPQGSGCDSLVFVDLTVIPVPNDSLEITICDTENYRVGDSTFNISGNYSVPIRRANGCDSLVNLDLLVNPSYNFSLQEQICENSSLRLGDSLFTETGQYRVIMTSAGGCDSIVDLDLLVQNNFPTNLSEGICEGQQFQVGDSVFVSDGQYQVLLLDRHGCDSLVNLELRTFPNYTLNRLEEVCRGDSIYIGGNAFGTQGTFTVPLVSQNLCDSTIILDLVVHDRPDTLIVASLCEGNSMMVGDSTFSTSGNFTIPFQTNSQC
ncbi:MAG: hypothetical protein R2879_22420, partial [Saprospiraceae bacterium]